MLDVHLNFIETELLSRNWFAGDEFTAADIMMSFPLEAALSCGRLDDGYSATVRRLDRVHKLVSGRKSVAPSTK